MNIFTPDQLSKWTSGEWVGSPSCAFADGFIHDTRKLKEGQVFVALRAERDGHDFLRNARERGATAAIVERRVEDIDMPQLVVDDSMTALWQMAKAHRAEFQGKLIGITGSCGKTSTKELLHLLLGIEQTYATPGNWNNAIGLPLTLLGLNNQIHRYGVIEVGINQPGEMSRLAGLLEPDIALVTMVGASHLEFLKNLEGVSREKAILGENVRPCGRVVFFEDLLKYESFQRLRNNMWIGLPMQKDRLPEVSEGQFFTYDIGSSEGQTVLSIQSAGLGLQEFRLRLLSSGQAHNAVLALATALNLGVDPSVLKERLNEWQPFENRGQIVQHGEQSFYIDCYNANPNSMSDTLEHFMSIFPPEKGPRMLILGSMGELGERTEVFHEEVGKSLDLNRKDQVVFVGESAEAMARGARSRILNRDQVFVLHSAEDVRPVLKDFRGNILIKGSRSLELESLIPPQIDFKKIPRKILC